jgi:WD40-like Beta Propeller Repeat
VRHELERVEIPDEAAARSRAWSVVESAFEERAPTPRPSSWPRVAAIAVALAALLAAAFSPPGQAVIDELREAVGVERAQPALFSLPTEGRLLVSSDAGVWVVQPDGSKRLLGDYREASWSPFGRFVVAARESELAAVEPDGDVRWTLARRGVSGPRWAGTETDTRIAYLDRSGIRVVAGDGTGDRVLVPGFRGAIAWKPGAEFVLARATARRLTLMDVETGRTLWERPLAGGAPVALEWSATGGRLLAATRRGLFVFDEDGNVPFELVVGAAPFEAAALAPDGAGAVFAQDAGRSSQLWVVPRIRPDANAARRLFSGPRPFADAAWSPDGRWLVVGWPAADQWVFVRANGAGIRAVANVSEQLRSRSFPRVEGWCCAG